MSPAISVIIPVFNGARYLRECLDSVCRQTLRDLEIICVDDGSTDDSLEILNSYAAKDSRIHIYSLPENKGAAAARNHGMDQATGEYLGFVDCDDYPCLDFYEKLWKGTEDGKFDVVKGNYRYWGEDGKSLPVDYSMNEELKKHKTSFSFAFASAIYKHKIITNNNIKFPEKQVDIEDPIFSLGVGLLCQSLNIVESAEINIRINKYSTTYRPPSEKRIQNKFDGLQTIIRILNSHQELDPESYAFVVTFWIKSILFDSIRRKDINAFMTILDNIWFAFINFHHIDACEKVFAAFELTDLFAALKRYSVNDSAAWLKKYYADNCFFVNSIRIKKLKSIISSKVCVAIPLHKQNPSESERLSLIQCLSVLGKHPIKFFGPESLDVAEYEQLAIDWAVPFEFIPMPDAYFRSTLHYSRLLLRPDFYSQFAEYEYMLIYQLDAWVFRDELDYWCAQGYDYIGAPWFEGYATSTPDAAFLAPGGNGGFSLRNVHALMKGTDAIVRSYTGKAGNTVYFNESEDVVLCSPIPSVDAEFSIAPVDVAMYFSWEVHPEVLHARTGCLPFGAHAVHDYSPGFWSQHIFEVE